MSKENSTKESSFEFILQQKRNQLNDQLKEDTLKKKYYKGIFFDNEQKYIDAVFSAKPNITCYKVNGYNYDSWNWINDISNTDFINKYNNYIKANDLESNPLYLELLIKQSEQLEQSIQTPENKDLLPYYNPQLRVDINSGLSFEDDATNSLTLLKNWHSNIGIISDQNKLCALFDWDRTITQIEFLWSRGNFDKDEVRPILPDYMKHNLINKHLINPEITDEDYLIFICGGKYRLSKLREMMEFCKFNNIDIILLTNNINCDLTSNECAILFNALVGEIGSDSTSQIRILCSSDPKFNNDKVLAIDSKCDFTEIIDSKTLSGGNKKIKINNHSKRKNKRQLTKYKKYKKNKINKTKIYKLKISKSKN